MENLENLSDSDLISIYGKLVKELKTRGIIRTKNVVGDLGERFVIDYYTHSPFLESLSDAPPSTKSIDAIGEHGNRFAIKTITGNLTGVFYGLPHKDSADNPEQLFDFLLIVIFSDSYEPKIIYELTWEQFLIHKRWHSRMEAWNILVNKQVKSVAKIIFKTFS
jgi:hypothetical protein